jgi:hypothetical protein
VSLTRARDSPKHKQITAHENTVKTVTWIKVYGILEKNELTHIPDSCFLVENARIFINCEYGSRCSKDVLKNV